MHHDLQKLLEDPRFLKYHAAIVKPRTFNPFDVLRYSDYEIRHSNVLAWLLQPDETHGLGGAFIRDFTTALNEAARGQSISAVPVPSSFEADNIRVERELDYVDITLFFENERAVVAIENKTGETAPEHAEQVRGYEETLRERYRGKYNVIQSVLLTSSREPGASGGDFVHMSWTRVHDIVNSIRERERFLSEEGERVRAFLGQYLEIVGKLTGPAETGANYLPAWAESGPGRPCVDAGQRRRLHAAGRRHGTSPSRQGVRQGRPASYSSRLGAMRSCSSGGAAAIASRCRSAASS